MLWLTGGVLLAPPHLKLNNNNEANNMIKVTLVDTKVNFIRQNLIPSASQQIEWNLY